MKNLASQAQAQVRVLAKALNDKDPKTRLAAAEALKAFKTNARLALPELKEALKDKKKNVLIRVYAAQILARLESDLASTPKTLLEIYKEPELPDALRLTIVEELGDLRSAAEVAVDELAKTMLKDKKADIRRAAVIALSKIGGDPMKLWPPTKKALKDPDQKVRHQAIRLTGVLARRMDDALNMLIVRCNTFAEKGDPDPSTENRLAAIQELGGLGAAARPAVDVLIQLAKTGGRASIREAALAALEKITAP